MDNRESGMGFFIGLLTGAVIGAALGFLYAPRTGKETRELVKERAGEVREKVSEMAEKSREAAVEARKRVEEKLGHKESAS
ncbi:MAG: YtxH domain-containing protein [Dehalococcoidales bacterium]|nr:YtxH domain-containing protein [Dehalococcoidales bacterium]